MKGIRATGLVVLVATAALGGAVLARFEPNTTYHEAPE